MAEKLGHKLSATSLLGQGSTFTLTLKVSKGDEDSCIDLIEDATVE